MIYSDLGLCELTGYVSDPVNSIFYYFTFLMILLSKPHLHVNMGDSNLLQRLMTFQFNVLHMTCKVLPFVQGSIIDVRKCCFFRVSYSELIFSTLKSLVLHNNRRWVPLSSCPIDRMDNNALGPQK